MLDVINKYVIGNSVPVVLILAGVFFIVFLGGRPMRTPIKLIKTMINGSGGDKDGKSISPFRSMTMALAGTLGVGNIVGVAGAIALGGFGAVFWMWVTALAAMILKYAEIVLALAGRRQGADGIKRGGAMYYIKACFLRMGLPKVGSVVATFFALLCVVDSLSMGCVVQVNAVSSALGGVFGVPSRACGLVMMILTALIITKGARRISALTEWLVPLMSMGYIVMSVAVMVICRDRLADALSAIFREAFNFKSGAGGVIGFLTADSLRYGSMRGLLSNEAGCGTSPFAHAASDVKEPAVQGVWGIFEVFIDTIVLCTMTAAVIILNYDACCAYSSDGVMMTVRAFSAVLGERAEYFLCAAVFLFAYATVICWAHYGLECVSYITHKLSPAYGSRVSLAYVVVFCACVFVGSVIAPSEVWALADLSIGSMTLINVFVLCLSAFEVRRHTDKVFIRRKNKVSPNRTHLW